MPIRVAFDHQDNRKGKVVVTTVRFMDYVPARTDKVVFNDIIYTISKVTWVLPHDDEHTVLIELMD